MSIPFEENVHACSFSSVQSFTPHSLTQSFTPVQLFATPCTTAHQALLSMEFFRQEYCNGLPFPTPGNFPDPRIEPNLLSLLHYLVGSLPLAPHGKPEAFVDLEFSTVSRP